jgi:hypothetical protein
MRLVQAHIRVGVVPHAAGVLVLVQQQYPCGGGQVLTRHERGIQTGVAGTDEAQVVLTAGRHR